MSRFQTTRWSVVLEARAGSEESRRALELLCRTYRAPVVAFLRGRGSSNEDAEDLAQAFFTRFIERDFHAQADPARGRFRSFLLTSLKHFLDDAREREQALKRGGRVQWQSLDDGAELAGARETPEQAFERAWAQAALRAAMRRLQAETSAAGKAALFAQLCEFLIERPDESEYQRIAETLNLRRNTLAVAVHRLRVRLRELVREELADTATDARELDREMHELRQSLAEVMA